MTNRRQVSCVNKSDRMNPHERILNIGGLNSDGTRWRISQQSAIEGILSGKWGLATYRENSVMFAKKTLIFYSDQTDSHWPPFV